MTVEAPHSKPDGFVRAGIRGFAHIAILGLLSFFASVVAAIVGTLIMVIGGYAFVFVFLPFVLPWALWMGFKLSLPVTFGVLPVISLVVKSSSAVRLLVLALDEFIGGAFIILCRLGTVVAHPPQPSAGSQLVILAGALAGAAAGAFYGRALHEIER